jgi:putative hemolysin
MFFILLRNVSVDDIFSKRTIGSREELIHLIEESKTVLTNDEKSLIINSMSFNSQLISSIMVPRPMIDFIEKAEFLGPLTLDNLYKKGHIQLPVVSGNIDSVVGVLNIKSLLSLDVKRSITAEKAMDKNVCYIRDDQTLQRAMAIFLKTKQQLLIVTNKHKETMGLLTLEDLIVALMGNKIISDDKNNNLDVVLSSGLRKNICSKKSNND